MAVIERTGDMFTSEAEALGHGVNVRGLMGAGIAREFRRRWPDMYREYRLLCDEGLLRPGTVYPYRTADGPVVVNVASQEYPGPDARLEWVRSGVEMALGYCTERGVRSLALPRIGCGIGGLTWADVRPLLERAAEFFPAVELEVWTL